MYAVIETGGKQYRVEVGTELEVERLDGEPGSSITFERVLLVADGDEASIGRPVVDGATVSAEVVRQDRADKVIVFKYRPKARRRVKKGHRQEQTVLRVSDIVLGGRSAAASVRKAEQERKTERQRLEEAAAKQAAEDAALAAKLAAQQSKAKPKTEPEAPKARASAKAKAEPADAKKAAPAKTTKAASTTTKPKAKADDAAKTADAPKGRAASTKSTAAAKTAPKARRTKKDE